MSEIEKRLKDYSLKKEVQEIEKELREDANKKLCLIDSTSNFPTEIKEGVIRPRRITPSEISIILHLIRKPNSIIVLLFIQNNS